MVATASIMLNTLHCISQSDGDGKGSEPYIWPFLAGTARRPFSFTATPLAASIAESKKLIASEMRAGQSVDLDGPFNQLGLGFTEDQTDQQLILIVALLESDGTASFPIAKGYRTFVRILNERLSTRLSDILAASQTEQAAIIAELRAEAVKEVMDVVKANMSTSDKLFRRDDFLAFAFRVFKAPLPEGNSGFTLRLKAPGDEFTLDGTLSFFKSGTHGPVGGGSKQPVLSP